MPILSQATTRRQHLYRAGSLALGFAVVACAGPRAAAPPSVTAAPPSLTRPAEAAAPLPVAQQNKVALLVPLSGANAAVGQSIANAATMALLDLGNSRINLRSYDTAAPGGAAGAAAKAVGDGAKLFLGPLLAPDVRAVQGAAAANGIPVLSFSNDAALAGGGTFVMGFQPGQSIARIVAYARSRGVERFAALVPAGIYGQRAGTAFLRAVENEGGKAVAVTSYARTSTGLLAAARKVTNYDARKATSAKSAAVRADGSVGAINLKLPPVAFQALLIADSGTIAAAVAPALAQFGAKPVLMGTELWNSEPALSRATALHGAVFAAVPDDRFAQLATRYTAKYGGRPSRLASFGYDAVLLVNGAAADWPLGAPFPRAALTTSDGFAGIDGVFRFAANGVAERGLEVQQVGPGGFATVAAAPRGFN